MRFWFAKNKENKTISEKEINWAHTKDIKQLSFNNNGQIITLPENLSYIQGKTASSFIGSKEVTIESRYIGVNYRNIIVKIRIDEKTNNINLEIEDLESKHS